MLILDRWTAGLKITWVANSLENGIKRNRKILVG